MPKPMMFRDAEKEKRSTVLSTDRTVRRETRNIFSSPKDRERILRQNRSQDYIDFLTELDTGNMDISQRIDAILDKLREEFPLIEIPGDFVGYCAKCFLGKDYEVHIVDFSGRVIEHYQKGHPMPGNMEKARGLAMDGHYALIEVYTSCLRAIDRSGNVSVIYLK